MTEYTYPECTTSVLTALSIFKQYYPNYRRSDIEHVVFLPIFYLMDLNGTTSHEQDGVPGRHSLYSQVSASRRILVWIMGYLFHLRHDVCPGKSWPQWRDVQHECECEERM